ncbi:MAG: hypothetical protein A3I44_05255 [Candidatus Sungbacteria bacterium RIFCSPLOWO2_02_FULL_51_17]|uniref:DUF3052 domain-containing protein n=1 Tax=Candidatus Sungbacteria bacterium RIFCSPHIGHO2_02_FULL_51_29 TaxID=1802273 RepID=A0A1G2KP42_9BACT|nr:MAG: hypothetical protein A2676_00690 [Candidatus Sungbacteria bacterium RIFCSPHIGHO2_01_FULL_51_22]OHA01187.1 MAG: hypothetical protein A3C16_04625 [Candidatus Sungbacteria bacterium RIFCSPHIGHO2_02_FULL_51_29]OHA08064.1 MAG: hypothetical protein A3B29_03785 [Candidatus Sungbacteria bacterium RIFCSPLOWO2_01_FULL_51_34]OHA11490.1 MAG: hypothetical protein A3I44_05255 [Candidatus Sungbacteria bacterium RIFCSPLOWO2_02_FULL_51_17]
MTEKTAQKKSLVKKLGIRPGFVLAIKSAPAGYEKMLGRLPVGFIRQDGRGRSLDFIQYFVHTAKELQEQLPHLKDKLKREGALWISWPKKRAQMGTDLSESRVRALGLAHGLRKIKVAGIGAHWNALKFVIRQSAKSKKAQR